MDWLRKYRGDSKVVLKPKTTQEVSDILKYCNEKRYESIVYITYTLILYALNAYLTVHYHIYTFIDYIDYINYITYRVHT